MRYSLVILVLILISFNTYPQITSLDEKRGFKKFQLEQSFYKWRDDLKFEKKELRGGGKVYSYSGYCCQDIFDYDVEKLLLTFKNKKLVAIKIGLDRYRKSSALSVLKNLYSNFESLFGEHDEKGKDDLSLHIGWLDEETTLILYNEYQKRDEKFIIMVSMFDNKFIKSWDKNTEGF